MINLGEIVQFVYFFTNSCNGIANMIHVNYQIKRDIPEKIKRDILEKVKILQDKANCKLKRLITKRQRKK